VLFELQILRFSYLASRLTALGLSVHMTQVHKETLDSIENALPNRSNLDVEIFGMEGVPADIVQSHNQRVLSQFHQAEAERRAATGNPAPGGAGGSGPKKPKFESPSEIKKRLAEHKAKKAAEQAAGISSGDVTPIGAGLGSQSPAIAQSPADFVSRSFRSTQVEHLLTTEQQAGSPPYPQQQLPYGGAPSNPAYPSFPQPYGQPVAPFVPPQVPFVQQQPGYGAIGMPQHPSPPQFPPNPPFLPPGGQAFSPPYQTGPSRPFGATSPPISVQQGQYQPPRMHTPPQNVALTQRSGSLPAAPGLPQRPSFGAPSVNAFQMQQMHQGQIPVPPNTIPSLGTHKAQQQQASWSPSQNGSNGNSSSNVANVVTSGVYAKEATNEASATASSIDVEMSGVAKDAEKTESKAEVQLGEKKTKKDKGKDKPVKLMYSDNEMSPEEKMAKLPRYAFVPDRKPETVLGEATTAAVTGVSVGVDDVLDPTD